MAPTHQKRNPAGQGATATKRNTSSQPHVSGALVRPGAPADPTESRPQAVSRLRDRIEHARSKVQAQPRYQMRHASTAARLPQPKTRDDQRQRKVLVGMHESHLESRSLNIAASTADFERDKMLFYQPISEPSNALDFAASLRCNQRSLDDAAGRSLLLLKAWTQFARLVRAQETAAIQHHKNAASRWRVYNSSLKLAGQHGAPRLPISTPTCHSTDQADCASADHMHVLSRDNSCNADSFDATVLPGALAGIVDPTGGGAMNMGDQVPAATDAQRSVHAMNHAGAEVLERSNHAGKSQGGLILQVGPSGVAVIEHRAVQLASFVLHHPALMHLVAQLPTCAATWSTLAVEVLPSESGQAVEEGVGKQTLTEESICNALHAATTTFRLPANARRLAKQLVHPLKAYMSSELNRKIGTPPDAPGTCGKLPSTASSAMQTSTDLSSRQLTTASTSLRSAISRQPSPITAPPHSTSTRTPPGTAQSLRYMRMPSLSLAPGVSLRPDYGSPGDIQPGVYNTYLRKLELDQLQRLADAGQLEQWLPGAIGASSRRRPRRGLPAGGSGARGCHTSLRLTRCRGLPPAAVKQEKPLWFKDWHDKGGLAGGVEANVPVRNPFLDWAKARTEAVLRPEPLSTLLDRGVLTTHMKNRDQFLACVAEERSGGLADLVSPSGGLPGVPAAADPKSRHTPLALFAHVNPKRMVWALPLTNASRSLQANVNDAIDRGKTIEIAEQLLRPLTGLAV